MGREKKSYTDRDREKALAFYAVLGNVTAVSRQMGIPRTTIQSWLGEAEDLDLEALRQKQKEKFIAEAWQIIADAQTVIGRRLLRAIDSEDAIDRLIGEVEATPDEELSRDARASLIRKLQAIRLDDLSKVAVVMGTMYDKAALASREVADGAGDSDSLENFNADDDDR